jgi:hypothetical protein
MGRGIDLSQSEGGKKMAEPIVYSGVAETLEGALTLAHDKIPMPVGKDYKISRVIDWGVQFGGFLEQTRYWVKIIADEHSPAMSDG